MLDGEKRAPNKLIKTENKLWSGFMEASNDQAGVGHLAQRHHGCTGPSTTSAAVN